MFRSVFNSFVFMIALVSATMLSATEPASSGEAVSYVYDESALDNYRMSIVSFQSSALEPTWQWDAYGVKTTYHLDNGLAVDEVYNLSYGYLASAVSAAEYLDKNYVGLFVPNMPRETHLRVNRGCASCRIKHNFSLSVSTGYGCVRIDRQANEAFFTTLPEVRKVEVLETTKEVEGLFWGTYEQTIYVLEICLSDGSVWHGDYGTYEPKVTWEVGERVLVSLDPAGAVFIRVDRNTDASVVNSSFLGMKFVGVTLD